MHPSLAQFSSNSTHFLLFLFSISPSMPEKSMFISRFLFEGSMSPEKKNTLFNPALSFLNREANTLSCNKQQSFCHAEDAI